MAQLWNELAKQVKSSGSEMVRAGSDLAQKVTSSSSLDAIPLASQGKSFVQFASGDREGAERTQDNFTKRCPFVSQVRSTLEHHRGDVSSARATEAEFDRNLRAADEAAKAALAPLEPLAQRFLGMAGEAAERAVDSADRAAQSLYESEIGRGFRGRFGDLLAQHHHSPDSCGRSSRDRWDGRGIASLDRYTILTEASGPQCGVQCSCCLESMQEGEAIRVLPCFHTLHDRCAEQWLLKQPICPVCRCDLRTSLEAMHS
jgi:hypothetical protein